MIEFRPVRGISLNNRESAFHAADKTTVNYNYDAQPQFYSAYLVRILAWDKDNDLIKFRGINLSNPDNVAGMNEYTVQLRQTQYVWPYHPSCLLDNFGAPDLDDPTKVCDSAILFLTSVFVKDKPDLEQLAKAGFTVEQDPNKWPAGAGNLELLVRSGVGKKFVAAFGREKLKEFFASLSAEDKMHVEQMFGEQMFGEQM